MQPIDFIFNFKFEKIIFFGIEFAYAFFKIKGGKMKHLSLFLLLASSILFIGCPQRQGQMLGTLILNDDLQNLSKGTYQTEFSYQYEPAKNGSLELEILSDQKEVLKTLVFNFSGGNVREVKNMLGITEYKILSLPDTTHKVAADITLIESPFEDNTDSLVTKKGIKVWVSITLYKGSLVSESLGVFNGSSERSVFVVDKNKPVRDDVYAIRSKRPVD